MKGNWPVFSRVSKVVLAVLTGFAASYAHGQTLSEINAAQAGQSQLDSGSVTGGFNAGMVQDRARGAAAQANQGMGATQSAMQQPMNPTAPLPNTAGGFSPAATSPAPGAAPMTAYPPVTGAAPAGGAPGAPAVPGAPGAPGATPTPAPTIKVLSGERIYCAVCGMLLEDAVQLTVPQSQQDQYLDDGIHDNGIANDGIRGNVETKKDKYIGPECNTIKNRLINVVRQAENIDPMHFYRYHVMALDPVTAGPNMPSVLEREQQRDDALRDWNSKFLADFRTDKDNPQSEFYQLYVPQPPQVPHYPVPPGYVSPQQMIEGKTAAPIVVTPALPVTAAAPAPAPGAAPGAPGAPGAPAAAPAQNAPAQQEGNEQDPSLAAGH